MTEGPAIDELRHRAAAWAADDPEPAHASHVFALLDDDDDDAIRALFARPLTFGTAGIRGPLGPGPGAMNEAVVCRLAASVAWWLDAGDVGGPVVIGRDARHGSAAFAAAIGDVLVASGRSVIVAEEPIPTPLLAFAVRHLEAAAGLMVTASHNPPQDNGVKVYASDGMQIISPMDRDIALRMAAIDRVGDGLGSTTDGAVRTPLDHEVVRAYQDAVAALRVVRGVPALEVAYTPMHGVGLPLLLGTFARAGLALPVAVPSQAEPDPDFPTLTFPNPEEPGAMDEVLALADAMDADLAVANDPDADRMAVAVRDGERWRVLSGDETGVVLADHLLRHGADDERIVARTVVSSTMLDHVAAAHGVECIETLTGFKWLMRTASDRPERLVLAYEEAIGFGIGEAVLDKDGIAAAVVMVEAAAALVADGSSVPRRLAELAVRHGLHRTRQLSFRTSGADAPARMAAMVGGFRADPPTVLAAEPVTEVEDLALGLRLPPTDGVIVHADSIRVVVRPSGTEPKLKCYLQVVVPVGDVDGVGPAMAAADVVLDEVERALVARFGG